MHLNIACNPDLEGPEINMRSGHRLILGAICVAAATGYLAYLGAAGSWQYYLSVDETVIDRANLLGKRIRVSGRVAVGSLRISNSRRDATFKLTGATHTLHVSCRCAMPDNLGEDMDVVVEGVLEADQIRGRKVITRCASKYQREVAVTGHYATGRYGTARTWVPSGAY